MLDTIHSFSTIAHIAVSFGLLGIYLNGKSNPHSLNRFLLWLIPIFILNSISLLLWSFSQAIDYGDYTLEQTDKFMNFVSIVAAGISYLVASLWVCLIIETGRMQKFPYLDKINAQRITLIYLAIPLALFAMLIGSGGLPYLLINILAMIILTRPLFIARDSQYAKSDTICTTMLLIAIIASDINNGLWISGTDLINRIRVAIAFHCVLLIILSRVNKSESLLLWIFGIVAFTIVMIFVNGIPSTGQVFGWGVLRPILILTLILGAIPKDSKKELGKWIGLHELILIALISSPLLEMIERLLPIDSIVAATIIAVIVALIATNNRGQFQSWISKFELEKSFFNNQNDAHGEPSAKFILIYVPIVTVVLCIASLVIKMHIVP